MINHYEVLNNFFFIFNIDSVYLCCSFLLYFNCSVFNRRVEVKEIILLSYFVTVEH